ncbi:hypothetical protein CLIM01_10582 [Colletotrichum limetticola]|uniref:Ankyrin repeat protein n=1 Tax=Colletotrichum limetticola TaxID=1209924 RepID=A0ABQ9PLA6_9PEZI|nr:hypothetical protein CLIM01_10582 [Colletotrichum limetticola]
MHGSDHIQQLDETIRLVRSIQPLGASDTSGRTGLMQAIDFQDLDVVDALLRADKELAKTPFLSPKHPDIFTYPIQFAAQIAARRDVPESLAIPQLINSYTDDLGSGSTSLDYTGKTILHLAVTGALSLVTQWILKERPGLIHAQDFSGQTPLHYCASAVNCDLLLDTGADIDHADKNGITALHRACLSGATEIVARLLKRTPRLDLRNNIYGTPIHCGVFSGSIDVVMELVSHGAPLNATDKKGNTAIHVAVKLNLHNILRLLVQYKADVRLKNIYGRDASAIAIQGGRAGNFRVLQILGHHKEVLEEQRNFETANVNTIDSSSEGESIGMQEMRPDFLWGEATLQPNETPSPRQSTAAKHYTHGEEQETYDQRTIRLVEFDQFISTTAQQYFPNFLERHWSKKAMVMLLSIFFEDAIWQPGLSEVILEVLARAACDLALLMDTYPRSPPLDIRRAVLWARYLLQCNGVDTAVQVEANQTFPKHDLTLESKFHDRSFRHPPLKALRANGPLYRGDLRSGNLPHWLKYFGWLDPAWMYLQHNDPHTVPTPLSQDADVQPRPHEGETQPFIIANEFLRDGLDLPYFLGFLQQQFHIVDTHESHQDVVDKIKENMGGDNPHNSHELKLSNAPDVEASDDSVPFCQAQAENGAKAETDPDHHINLATDWIVDIFMSRKPETMLPERLKSDVKMLVRWETRMYRMSPPESETTQARYTSSLFHKFPQLSRNGIRWRENLYQEYFDWKFKTTSDQPPYLETTEQNEFFETIYLFCTRGFEEIQLDESESKIGRFVQPFTADGKDTSEVSTINDEISGRYPNIDDWMFNVASKPDKQMDESLEPISAEKSAYHSGGPISGVIRQEYQGLAERDSFSLFGFGGSPLLDRGSSGPLD